ncbi:class I SAM-dependent methyltransferase [Paenibacillus sp. GD4]|uniref:class I SAM-dependent methyltransferase n=1 Tax=Paenibacillus sp. GD4 TaxID=3068890 RepID=UPI00279686BF|nr:class I SAM-dependent methyltransferase [Paenibacillus sp. GD4]MDQ1910687.1 class I SAM-dependent methyltransferase [Paenibacillus sp. GD4]
MNNKERFSNRVEAYVKHRPSYPKEALDYLYEVVGFQPGSSIADIGSGTGKFSRLLLERGSTVLAIEPNREMREAAEAALASESRYRSVAAAAEETGLPDQSVDYIVCAQSFHWFDRAAAQVEFHRILKPGGKVALIWNSRRIGGTPFMEAYDRLVRTYGIDYDNVGHKVITADTLKPFFQADKLTLGRFDYRQYFDYEGLQGRLVSSSYIPTPGHPSYEPMMAELKRIFEQNRQEGLVEFLYDTEVFWGEV